MWDTMLKLLNGTIAAMGQAQQASLIATARNMELAAYTYARLWGLPEDQVMPGDNRFKEDIWQDNLAFDVMKQAYLITSEWMKQAAHSLGKVDPDLQSRALFWTNQFTDMLSPTNFPVTNPVVWQEALRSGGGSMLQGMQNLLMDIQQGRVSQVPEGSFVVGKDLASTPGKVVYRNPLIELIQYQPSTEKVHAVPLLAIPPWINKYYVMDMRPENSLYKYLIDSGFTLFTISWKNPDESVLDLGWEDYMDMGPIQAIRVMQEITGAEKVNTLGYCLGGIIQQTTLAYMAAVGDEPVNSATYFATHQDFTKAGEINIFIDEQQVQFLEWLMSVSGGYLDGRNMAATFNMLRANDLLWNYVVNNYLLGKQPPAFDLLYWNSDGTRVPAKVHSFLVREFFMKNKLREPGGVKLKGVGIDLGKVKNPTYTVAALGDHIVPWDGTFLMQELLGGPVRFILTSGGHIAGIINPPAQKKREYWTNDDPTTDADEWLKGAEKHAGSWWMDWVPWLKRHSGRKVTPPPVGGEGYAPIMDAPGTYVLEK